MTHLDEGTLQAFLDDELDAPGRASVAEHLLSCEACQTAHQELLHANAIFSRAVSHLDSAGSPRPATGARSRTRFGTSSFVKAAGLILALAAAGSAAVPGSPVREWIADSLAPEAETPAPRPEPAPEPVAREAAPAPAGVFVASSGRTVIALAGLEGSTIRLAESSGDRVGVSVSGAERDPVFRTRPGRIDVQGGVGGEVVVRFPAEGEARLEVDGRLYAECAAGSLRVLVPADTSSGHPVWR